MGYEDYKVLLAEVKSQKKPMQTCAPNKYSLEYQEMFVKVFGICVLCIQIICVFVYMCIHIVVYLCICAFVVYEWGSTGPGKEDFSG